MGKKKTTSESHLFHAVEMLFLQFAIIFFPFYGQPFLSKFVEKLKDILVDDVSFKVCMDHTQKWWTTNRSKVLFFWFHHNFSKMINYFPLKQFFSKKKKPAQNFKEEFWNSTFGYSLVFAVDDVRLYFGVSSDQIIKERSDTFLKLRFFWIFQDFSSSKR